MRASFKRNFLPELFIWKELELLINIRPLMNTRRVASPGTEIKKSWDNDIWAIDQDCYPASILEELISNRIVYLKDMTRCSQKINDFAKSLE